MPLKKIAQRGFPIFFCAVIGPPPGQDLVQAIQQPFSGCGKREHELAGVGQPGAIGIGKLVDNEPQCIPVKVRQAGRLRCLVLRWPSTSFGRIRLRLAWRQASRSGKQFLGAGLDAWPHSAVGCGRSTAPLPQARMARQGPVRRQEVVQARRRRQVRRGGTT